MSAHVHHCPRCHEQPACDLDCDIEPDLGTTSKGVAKAAHCVCEACATAPVDRSQCTGHVIFAMVELTDDALAHLARYVDTLAKRPLTAEALNDAQRAREQGAA